MQGKTELTEWIKYGIFNQSLITMSRYGPFDFYYRDITFAVITITKKCKMSIRNLNLLHIFCNSGNDNTTKHLLYFLWIRNTVITFYSTVPPTFTLHFPMSHSFVRGWHVVKYKWLKTTVVSSEDYSWSCVCCSRVYCAVHVADTLSGDSLQQSDLLPPLQASTTGSLERFRYHGI